MRVPCPECGLRDVREFSCLGEIPSARSALDAPAEIHAESVYLRENPMGPLDELWYHSAGCRAWIVATRDTRSHTIVQARFARTVALAASGVAGDRS